MPNIETILRDHTTPKLECIDRLYLNGYQPTLQHEAGLLRFLLVQRKQLVASPVLLGQMTKAFVGAVESFAKRHSIPVVHFEKGQRKEDVAQQHFARVGDREGIVFIGLAQEKVTALRSFKQRRPDRPRAFLRFYRGQVFVKQFYFYLFDRDFGPAFIKFSTYFPFTVRVWINGHEWAKRQLARKGITFEALDNGLLSVGDAARAQDICDRLDADRIDAFFRKWLARLPHPLSRDDRAAGYRYSLSILQMEISRTEVFDRPLARLRRALTVDSPQLRTALDCQLSTVDAGRRPAKSYARVLRRGLARLDIPPPDDASDPLVKAWHRLDQELDRFVEEAKMVA